MRSILERLKRGEVIVGDGALGTMLIQRGLESGQCPELFNITRPEIVEEIARLYREAGAEIITTNTFGASPDRLAEYGLEDRMEEINRKGVSIAKKAVKIAAEKEARKEKDVYIAASCGSSGKILKPYGEADPEEIYNGFVRQMEALVHEGADVICIETMIDLQEARLLVKAAKSVSPEIPVIATMTFDETPRGFFTIMGVSIKDACAGLEEAGADIIGSNCGNGIEKMVRIAREFKNHSTLPLIIQSNAGLPEIQEGKIFYSETPEFFAGKVADLIDAGVSIIGGCCGTTPAHIRAIRDAVDAIQKTNDPIIFQG